MRILLLLLPFMLFAQEANKTKLINCYEIFEQRKAELQSKVDKIEEQRQAFIALKDASMNILKKKEIKIKQRQQEVNATLTKIDKEKNQTAQLVKQYQKILDDIKKANAGKLVQSYSKMRAGNAAKIVQDMDTKVALDILSKLSPKVLSKMFSKMDAQKAAILTKKLLNYRPKGE